MSLNSPLFKKHHTHGGDIFKEGKTRTVADIDVGRIEKIKMWNHFFRKNPHRFIETYFGVRLYPYQVVMIWMLQKSFLAYFVASRAAAKSFIIALWSLTIAVLYPGSEVIACSKTIKQGSIILDKISSLRDIYPNIAREIKSITINANMNICYLHNGSTIKVVPSSESSRGNRATYIIIEESRLVPKEILEAIIKPFLYSRKPPYMLTNKYSSIPDLQEEGRISYITSAWYKSEYWYAYVKQTIKKMVSGDDAYNFLALDYLITIFHSIKTSAMIEAEKSDIDPMTFQLEYLNIPAGQSGKSYFRQSMFPRVIRKSFYPQKDDDYNPRKNPYGIKKVQGELRLICCDVATRANKENDQTAIGCIRLLPTSRGYERQLVYLDVSKGRSTILQALGIKRLMDDFEGDFIVLDLQQAGITLFDLLSQATTDDIRGKTYDGFTVYPHSSLDEALIKELMTRTISLNARPLIYPILATQRLNNDIAVSFRSALQKKLWHFLSSDVDGEEYLIKTNKEFLEIKDDSYSRSFYISPYVNTDFLVSECCNLELSLVNGLIKLTEPSGGWKDRYSTVSYANWFISFLDNEIMKENTTYSDWEAISGMTVVL